MADNNKKKKKKKKSTTSEKRTYIKRKVVNMDALEKFAELVGGRLGERVLLTGWNSDLEKLANDGYIKAVPKAGGYRAWLTSKGVAELNKKR